MAQPPPEDKNNLNMTRSTYLYRVNQPPAVIDQSALREFDMASCDAVPVTTGASPVMSAPAPTLTVSAPAPVTVAGAEATDTKDPKDEPPQDKEKEKEKDKEKEKTKPAKSPAKTPTSSKKKVAKKTASSRATSITVTEKTSTTTRTGRPKDKDGTDKGAKPATSLSTGAAGTGPLPAGAPEVGNQTKIQHLHTEDVRRVAESLSNTAYYHGFLPRDEIESMLKTNGNYLLRATDHANERRIAVSVLWQGKSRHVLLNRSSKGWWFLQHTYCMPSIEELINLHQDKAIPVNQLGAIIKKSIGRSSWQLLHEDIKEKKKLGNGAFGEVWSGTLHGKQNVAIKKMRTTGPVTKEQRKQFVAEARLMRQLDHDNIVRVLGVAANEEPIMLVMELLTGGSLLGVLRNKKDPPTPVLLERFVLDAAKGMVYLESKRFIHRDLAARNCLLNEEKRVKISDFGLSMVSSGVHKELSTMKVPIKWLAPEVLTKMLYSHKSDVWAFGVLCWETYSLGKEPYTGMNNADTKQKLIGENYRMPLPASMPKNTQKLVTDMWKKDPDQRPSFDQIHTRLTSK